MKRLRTELLFDGRRLIMRNGSFLFFALLMPAGFYLLFTKVMIQAPAAELHAFAKTYLGSMVVYSGAISALFSMANVMQQDRQQGFVAMLRLSSAGLTCYAVSLVFWALAMNLASLVLVGGLATVVNQVQLRVSQWVGMGLLSMLGEAPLLGLAALIARVPRPETLSLLSNFITFPLAIISGLWWPLTMLPTWAQHIGKVMPTYLIDQLMGATMNGGTLNTSAFIGVVLWLLGLALLAILGPKILHSWRMGRVHA